MSTSQLSFENEVFSKFAFYAGVVLLKTVVMSMWTARYRIPRKVSCAGLLISSYMPCWRFAASEMGLHCLSMTFR